MVLPMIMAAGCVSQWNTRLPSTVFRPSELERREAQIHDPFPDDDFGPDVGFRPLGYQEQRPESQRAKDRFYAGFIRQRNAPRSQPFAPTGVPRQSMVPPNSGQYFAPPATSQVPAQNPYPGSYPPQMSYPAVHPQAFVPPSASGYYYPR